jgi:hypothetical protein
MTVPSQPAGAERRDQQSLDRQRRRVAERRRLDEIFGDVLPATTDDEREPGERHGFDAEYYRANRPPHHDR